MPTARAELIEAANRSQRNPSLFQSLPECEVCNDTTWRLIGGQARRCECQRRRTMAARIQTILADWPEYAEVDLEQINPKTLRQSDALQRIRHDPEGSYFLFGSYSAGKTHLMIAQYRALALRGEHCLLRSGKQLADELRQAEMKPAEGQQPFISPVLQAAAAADRFHLFWDDISKAAARSDFSAEAIFDLLDTLKRRQLSVTITSNLPLNDSGPKKEDLRAVLGQAAVARIHAMCTQVQL